MINPILAAAWRRENDLPIESAAAHREIDGANVRAISPRTRARALGYLRGWDDARMALAGAISAEFTRIIAALGAENRPGELVTASEIAAAIERLTALHSAHIRTDAERKEAA